MMLGLSLRVSWICLLLFSSGACFPATKGDYKYPYTATWRSGGGSAPGSANLQSEDSRAPLVSLQYEPSANLQQPAASVQKAGSPAGNQPSSSLGAPSIVATGSSPSYQPNGFLVTYDSSAPVVASSSAAYVSPPVGTGKTTPSFPVQPPPAASSGGESNVGSYSPVYEAPSTSFTYPAGNAGQPSLDTAVPYRDPFSDSSLSWDNLPKGAAASPGSPSAGGAYDPSGWVPSPSAGGAYDPSAWVPSPSAGGAYDPSAWVPSPSAGGAYDPSGWVPSPSAGGAYDPSGWVPSPSAGGAYDPSGWVPSPSAGGAYDPSGWVPSGSFPDFSVWDSAQGGSQETSPLPPSSYIIQSRSGYQRAREVFSNMKYSPEFPQLPVSSSKAVRAPSMFPAEPVSKGGRKV